MKAMPPLASLPPTAVFGWDWYTSSIGHDGLKLILILRNSFFPLHVGDGDGHNDDADGDDCDFVVVLITVALVIVNMLVMMNMTNLPADGKRRMQGSMLFPRPQANFAFYGKKLSTQEILFSEDMPPKAACKPLVDALELIERLELGAPDTAPVGA
jgi:hypothetical protein